MIETIKHIALLLMVLSLPANAEVFKCKLAASGKIIYQSTPCPKATATQDIVKIEEMDPEKAEEAKAKLKAWQEQLSIKEAAEAEAKKQRQIELDRQENLELNRRNAIALEQQAISAQQRQEQGNSIMVIPSYRPGYWDNNQSHHDRLDSPMPPTPYPRPKPSARHPGQPRHGLLDHHK